MNFDEWNSVNKIKELPDEFGAMPRLRVLDLSSNELERLPAGFFRLSTHTLHT